jgi:hypothetical protein
MNREGQRYRCLLLDKGSFNIGQNDPKNGLQALERQRVTKAKTMPDPSFDPLLDFTGRVAPGAV